MRRGLFALFCFAALCVSFAAAKEPVFQEALRPQFHFTAERNWLNDPNGLVFFAGEYHLFFQHNPLGNEWGSMTWGHAVSDDLVHWQQLENALAPDARGTIYSGSAVVDWRNTAGLQSGQEPALVALYTAAGNQSPESAGQPFTQCFAFSNDRGRTWTKFDGNPVLGHVAGENRDPKVIWHEPTRHWVMALYLDGNKFALYRSPDLKSWTLTDKFDVPGSIECPDLFELPVVGSSGETKWVFWTANNVYLVGDFDGKKFAPIGGPQRFEFGANRFAAQTYSDIPTSDGRRIQIAWMRDGKYPGMPFNQQMTFPTTLRLHATTGGYRLHSQPVAEIEALRGNALEWAGELDEGENPLATLQGDLYDIAMTISPGKAEKIELALSGMNVEYDVSGEELRCGGSRARVQLERGVLEFRVLVDRTSIEIFANDGAVSISNCFVPKESNRTYTLQGDGARVETLKVWPLRSAWANLEE